MLTNWTLRCARNESLHVCILRDMHSHAYAERGNLQLMYLDGEQIADCCHYSNLGSMTHEHSDIEKLKLRAEDA
jgi:hypothetical protein